MTPIGVGPHGRVHIAFRECWDRPLEPAPDAIGGGRSSREADAS